MPDNVSLGELTLLLRSAAEQLRQRVFPDSAPYPPFTVPMTLEEAVEQAVNCMAGALVLLDKYKGK